MAANYRLDFNNPFYKTDEGKKVLKKLAQLNGTIEITNNKLRDSQAHVRELEQQIEVIYQAQNG